MHAIYSYLCKEVPLGGLLETARDTTSLPNGKCYHITTKYTYYTAYSLRPMYPGIYSEKRTQYSTTRVVAPPALHRHAFSQPAPPPSPPRCYRPETTGSSVRLKMSFCLFKLGVHPLFRMIFRISLKLPRLRSRRRATPHRKGPRHATCSCKCGLAESAFLEFVK